MGFLRRVAAARCADVFPDTPARFWPLVFSGLPSDCRAVTRHVCSLWSGAFVSAADSLRLSRLVRCSRVSLHCVRRRVAFWRVSTFRLLHREPGVYSRLRFHHCSDRLFALETGEMKRAPNQPPGCVKTFCVFESDDPLGRKIASFENPLRSAPVNSRLAG